MKRLGQIAGADLSRFGATVVVVLALPFWLTGAYADTVLVTIAMFATASLGARLVMRTGLWSFGQGAFATVGSYVVALLMVRAGWSFWAALPLSGVVGGCLGIAFGYPALRVRGVYFAILTMVAVFAITEVISVTPGFTGGAGGLVNIPIPSNISVFGLTATFGSPRSFYYLSAVIFLIGFTLMWRLDCSRLATEMTALAQNEDLAAAVGVNVRAYRLVAFGVACAMTGVVGGFSASYDGLAHPDIWSLWPSVYIIAYAIVGGTGTVWGPVIGTAAVVTAEQAFQAAPQMQTLLLGVALIVVMRVAPDGLTPLCTHALKWVGTGLGRSGHWQGRVAQRVGLGLRGDGEEKALDE